MKNVNREKDYITSKKNSEVKISDVLFPTVHLGHLAQNFRTLCWNITKVNLRLKIHELDLTNACENDSLITP